MMLYNTKNDDMSVTVIVLDVHCNCSLLLETWDRTL